MLFLLLKNKLWIRVESFSSTDTFKLDFNFVMSRSHEVVESNKDLVYPSKGTRCKTVTQPEHGH